MNVPPPPLRILHYLHSVRLAHGGVVRAVLDLCSTLANRGHDITLATIDGKDVPHEWARPSANGEPRKVPRVFELSRAKFALQIRDQIRASQVVHMHGPWDVHNLAAASGARNLKTPYVLTLHGMLDDWSMAQKALKKRVYHALFARQLLNNAAFVHCTALAELEQSQQWFRGERGVVLPYVVDFSPFKSLPGPELVRARFPFLADDRFKLLFLSRLHYKKGAEALIDAASLLRQQGLDFTLVIAGSGETAYVRSLKRRIEMLGLKDRAHLVGLITGADKLSLFQACDLFVLPTSQENFGLVLAESLACGTPVLTTRGTDIWREIEQGGGIICEATPRVAAQKIHELAADRDALAERGQSGRKWVMRFFDADRLVEGYESLYSQAIAGQV